MPVHPSEEEAPSHITDQVAQQSSDSTASTHPLHTGGGDSTSQAASGGSFQDQASAMADTLTQKAKEFATTASNTATSLASQAQKYINEQTGGGGKEKHGTGGLTDNVASQAEGFLDGNATSGVSHSKYVQDEQSPGVTDKVTENAKAFEESVEGK